MNIHFTLKNHRKQANPGRIPWLVLLALLASLAPFTLSAQGSDHPPQTGILTLMPTAVEIGDPTVCPPLTISAIGEQPQCSALLRFRSDALPDGGIVTAARLNLVAQTVSSAGQTITVHKLPFDATLGEEGASETDTVFCEMILESVLLPAGHRRECSATTEARQELSEEGGIADGFSLRLTTYRGHRQWYSDQTEESSLRPRLILEYEVDGQPAQSQSDGLPYVQSSRAFPPTGAQASGDTKQYYTTISFPEAWSYTPAFYRDLVYQIIDDQEQKMLQAYSALGGPVGTPCRLNNPGQHLLVSPTGRVYIVGNDRIQMIQLDSQGKPMDCDVRDFPVKNLNPGTPPTLGSDGSIYVVNGIEVYGINPDLQELWKVTLSDKTTSRVTVGPSSRFVYLIVKSEGLVAINAQTGERAIVRDEAQDRWLNKELLTFRAPLVVRHPDGSEVIYAVANSANAGFMAKFDNPMTVALQGETGTIVAAQSWTVENTEDSLWSQPILDQLPPSSPSAPDTANPAKKLYAVNVVDGVGTVLAIDWLSGATERMTPTLPVAASTYLLDGGNLVLDTEGTLFVWKGEGTGPGLYAFGSGLAGLVAAENTGIEPRSKLLFGTDGTLYATGSHRVLHALVPRYALGSDAAAEIYSPTHLAVTGVVTKSTTLAAGGSLMLGSGFRVQVLEGQGFALRLRTGVTTVPELPALQTNTDGR